MTERITLALVAIACLTATVLPSATERIVIMPVEKPKPTMFLSCEKRDMEEYKRACYQRSKSI